MPDITNNKTNMDILNKEIAKNEGVIEISESNKTKPMVCREQDTIPVWWSNKNAMTVSSAVLIFGIFVMMLITYLVRHGKSTESVLRIFGTILIIISALFLIVAGYSDKQIAPVLGLLGTIAGYLLGKEENKRDDAKKDEIKLERKDSDG